MSERCFIMCKINNVILVDGSQASMARPSGRGNVKVGRWPETAAAGPLLSHLPVKWVVLEHSPLSLQEQKSRGSAVGTASRYGIEGRMFGVGTR
jgi:hypothetical protein